MKNVGSKFRCNIKVSLMAGNLDATDVHEIKLPKFKTVQKKIDCIESVEFWEQEENEATKDDYHKFSSITLKDL